MFGTTWASTRQNAAKMTGTAAPKINLRKIRGSMAHSGDAHDHGKHIVVHGNLRPGQRVVFQIGIFSPKKEPAKNLVANACPRLNSGA
jgi:hypothetical protein